MSVRFCDMADRDTEMAAAARFGVLSDDDTCL